MTTLISLCVVTAVNKTDFQASIGYEKLGEWENLDEMVEWFDRVGVEKKAPLSNAEPLLLSSEDVSDAWSHYEQHPENSWIFQNSWGDLVNKNSVVGAFASAADKIKKGKTAVVYLVC